MFTYQDWLAASDRAAMLMEIIRGYKASDAFLGALAAQDYFLSENREVRRKTVLRSVSYTVRDERGGTRRSARQEAVPGTRIASNFFFRFVTQQCQFLLGNGVSLGDAALKARLGPGFDTALQIAGERALVHGVCWGFWNADHLEVIEAARDPLSGFVALMDERSGQPMLGVQFWQLEAARPLYARLFEPDGLTLYRDAGQGLQVAEPKRPYLTRAAVDAAGEQPLKADPYPFLPVVPLWANTDHRSELTYAIRQKIDAYDRILSDFGDNLEQANDVYWVLNNFGGTMDDIADMLEQIRRLKVISSISDGTAQSTAEPKAFQVPYAARQAALDILRRELYRDAMAIDNDEIRGGSLTNVAIRAAYGNLNLKCDRFEWQVFSFVQAILRLVGIETETISFTRQDIVNRSEIVADIAAMRADIDRPTALRLNPYLSQDDVAALLADG